MELGRECLKLWGYERVDEIIWVKTNQLVSPFPLSIYTLAYFLAE